ncbi:hypothetical protein [Actinomadura rupiterrae]|uniref:hypothetical protein n=1 Tax=Actinomadura rupiterrae TaxID=559627 RepID=UPI0020A2A9B5|nr:hypothetical protein [Actinomadura rupiterrae]MCP2335965.1 hypothetical protein [Actinomadura rupiterrae]
MTDPDRGWTVFCQEEAAADLHAMPSPLFEAVLTYLVHFATQAGAAINAGAQPPGTPRDNAGHRYDLCIPGHPVIIEYLVVQDIKEFRITTVLWLG